MVHGRSSIGSSRDHDGKPTVGRFTFRDKAGHISLRGFFARRALRIFPLYYTVLGLYAALVFLSEKDPVVRGDFFSNLPAFLTYTSNWFVPPAADKRVIFYFAWSLATEEQFYLVWPLVMALSRRTWVPVAFMSALLTLALVAAQRGKEDEVAAAEFVLASLPQRLAQSIQEEMATFDRIKPAEAEAAQAAILNAVRDRAAAGEIELVEEEDGSAP